MEKTKLKAKHTLGCLQEITTVLTAIHSPVRVSHSEPFELRQSMPLSSLMAPLCIELDINDSFKEEGDTGSGRHVRHPAMQTFKIQTKEYRVRHLFNSRIKFAKYMFMHTSSTCPLFARLKRIVPLYERRARNALRPERS